MTTFEVPKNPRCTVWTRKGDRFDYDREYNRYQRTHPDGEVVYLSWGDLVYMYGPLTDTNIPKVGETFIVDEDHRVYAVDIPEGAVMAKGDGVPWAKLDGRLRGMESMKSFAALPDGLWTRLR